MSRLFLNTKGLKYHEGDSRRLLARYESAKYGQSEGWKISLSLHPYLFYWRKSYREFRLTILCFNVHFLRN
jgi:hypothetical protein